METTANKNQLFNEPIKNHGIFVKPSDLKPGDIIFYEMYQFLALRKLFGKISNYVFGYFNRFMNYTVGGFPKICHIGVVVEGNKDDPFIIDFCDNDGGKVRKVELSKFAKCASSGKVYIVNKETQPHQGHGAIRAEKYYKAFISGESKEFYKNYDLWSHNCTDFVNKCCVLSGYKFNECVAVNKSTSSRSEVLAEFFCINKEQMGDGYRTIILENNQKQSKEPIILKEK